jgi:transcription elongation factor Elf1
MRSKEIKSRNRRDFTAIYVCEHCGNLNVIEGNGYDDEHFHQNVISNMVCKACGKKTSETYRPLSAKHPEGMQI